MDALRDVWNQQIFGDLQVGHLVLAVVAVFLGFSAGRAAHRLLAKVGERTPAGGFRRAILEAFSRPLVWSLRAAGIFGGLLLLPLPDGPKRFVLQLASGTTIALATWVGTRLVDGVCDMWARKAAETEDTFDDQLVPITRKAANVSLVLIGGVMILQNMNYSVSSLLAGLGIGGAALAFASKDTVANFFGSLVVFIDRPFQVGDWVEMGSVEGTVEEVGLRVTTIRTFANSLITVPNSMFTTTAINNWSRMKKRRIKMTIGLTYSTTPDKMRAAVEAIRNIIRSDDRLHQDFYLVNFYDFGPSSLDIFCYLFSRTTNWAEHMQIREEFMLRIMDAMHGLGLSFAFPTQSVHVESMPGPAPRSAASPGSHRELPGAPKAMLRDTPL